MAVKHTVFNLSLIILALNGRHRKARRRPAVATTLSVNGRSDPAREILLFFTSACPPVAEIVRARETELTQPVFDNAGHIIDIRRGRLHNRSAAEYAAEQVASYVAHPTRIVFNPPYLDDMHDACTHAMAANLETAANDRLAQPSLDRGGVLMVVGVGLGCTFPIW